MWILGWQSQGSIKFYPKQFAKACKMTEEEVDLCIETLVNTKLLDVSKVDQTYMLTPNAEQFQKYYDVPISKVIEGKGIPMATEVTWKESDSNEEFDIASMDEREITAMILRLQASLNEKKQLKGMIKDNEPTDLPF
jgi:hypothetical protein